MHYTYKTKGTCSQQIDLDINGDIVSNVSFLGGCNGNTKAVAALVEGLTVDQIVSKIGGMQCGFRGTSCPDQLSIAVQEAYAKSQEA